MMELSTINNQTNLMTYFFSHYSLETDNLLRQSRDKSDEQNLQSLLAHFTISFSSKLQSTHGWSNENFSVMSFILS